MISIADKEHKPSMDEISEHIDNPLFDELCHCMQTECKALVEIAYSGDNVLLGWNVRFHKSGRTLCRLYPKRGSFSVLVVIGRKEKDRVEVLLPGMSAELQGIYRDTPEGMGQRWLIMDFDQRNAAYEDLLKIARIRMGK